MSDSLQQEKVAQKMANTIVRIIKIIFGVAAVVSFGFPLLVMYRIKKRTAAISTMSAQQLKGLAQKQPLAHCNNVVKELVSRGEDISFAMPLYLKMACDGYLLKRIIGWQGLKVYFSHQLPQIDFSEERPSKDTLEQLRSIESESRNSSGS